MLKKIASPLLLIVLSTVIAFAQEGEFKLDRVYEIDVNGTITLSSDDANVRIIGTDRKDVHVQIYRKIETKGLSWGGKDFSVEVETFGGDIKIYEKTDGGSVNFIGYMREDYRIDIEAPKSVSLDIKGDDGDHDIRYINGSIALDIDDGDAEFTACGGDDFRFRYDDSDIIMDQGKGRLYVDGDDGDIEISNGKFTEIDITLDDGDVLIQTSLEDNGEYHFRSNDGSILLELTKGGGEFDLRHDDSRVSTDGSFEKLMKNDDYTRLKLDGGNAKVKIRVDDGSIRLSQS